MVAHRLSQRASVVLHNSIQHGRLDLYGRWLVVPAEEVDIEDKVATGTVDRVVPDVRSLRNRRRDRLGHMNRIVRSDRTLFLPCDHDRVAEHQPDSTRRQREFELHHAPGAAFEYAVPVIVASQEVPEILRVAEVFRVIFVRIQTRVAGKILISSRTVTENELRREFGRVHPARVPVRIVHPEIDPVPASSQTVVCQHICAVADNDSAHVVRVVLVQSGERMVHDEFDIHTEKSRIVVVDMYLIERDTILRNGHLVQKRDYVQGKRDVPVLDRFECSGLDVEIDIIVAQKVGIGARYGLHRGCGRREILRRRDRIGRTLAASDQNYQDDW